MEFEAVAGYAVVFGIMFLVGFTILGGWFTTGITTAQAQNDPKMQLLLAIAIPAIIVMLIYGWNTRLEPGVVGR